MKENIKRRGKCIVKRFNIQTGEILETIVQDNLVVDAGLENMAKDMINTGYKYNAIIVGDGVATGTPNSAETSLINYIKGASAILSYEASFKSVFVATITFSSAYTITEAALAELIADANIFNHVLFSPGLSVDATTGLEITFKISHS